MSLIWLESIQIYTDIIFVDYFYIFFFEWDLIWMRINELKGVKGIMYEINVCNRCFMCTIHVYVCVCVRYWRPGVFRIITPNRKDIKENSRYKEKESFRERKILMKRILRENEVEIVSRIIPLLKIIFLTSIDSILKRILRDEYSRWKISNYISK